MNISLSNKQGDFLLNSTADINLASGAIRSGKTYASNLRFMYWLENEAIPRKNVLITGKTGESLELNVTSEILDMASKIRGMEDAFKYTRNPRQLVYRPKGIICRCVGANDEGAEERVRGNTYQGWDGDEITLYPQSFFNHAFGRVSAGPRFKIWTCNPDNPSHYVKTEIIDKIEAGLLQGKVWYFGLPDNETLSPEYINQIKTLYTGVFYDRFILGKWVMAEGAVYDRFDRSVHVIDSYPEKAITEWLLGIDWGYENELALMLYGVTGDDVYYCVDEIYLKRQLVDKSLIEIMRQKGWFNLKLFRWNGFRFDVFEDKPSYAWCDSNRPEYIKLFQDLTGITSFPAVKDSKVEMIQAVQRRYVPGGNGKCGLYYIKGKCPNMLREKDGYRWKPGSKDDVIKEDDHAQDAEQYLIYSRNKGRVRFVKK